MTDGLSGQFNAYLHGLVEFFGEEFCAVFDDSDQMKEKFSKSTNVVEWILLLITLKNKSLLASISNQFYLT